MSQSGISTLIPRPLKIMLLLAAMAHPIAVKAKDVELSWEKGTAFIPGGLFPRSPKNISLDGKRPVLIYLHGCTGITHNHDTLWAQEIAKLGFVVVMPDSFARPGRVPDCDPSRKRRSNAFPKAHQYRQEEITYSLEQVRRAAWADQRNIFLMGHSEGGQATARSRHDAWNAQVISGWTCTFEGRPESAGIHSPKHIPALAVAYLDDPWRTAGPTRGRCVDQAGDRKVEQVDLPGSGHGTFHEDAAREAVFRFLKANLRPLSAE